VRVGGDTVDLLLEFGLSARGESEEQKDQEKAHESSVTTTAVVRRAVVWGSWLASATRRESTGLKTRHYKDTRKCMARGRNDKNPQQKRHVGHPAGSWVGR